MLKEVESDHDISLKKEAAEKAKQQRKEKLLAALKKDPDVAIAEEFQQDSEVQAVKKNAKAALEIAAGEKHRLKKTLQPTISEPASAQVQLDRQLDELDSVVAQNTIRIEKHQKAVDDASKHSLQDQSGLEKLYKGLTDDRGQISVLLQAVRELNGGARGEELSRLLEEQERTLAGLFDTATRLYRKAREEAGRPQMPVSVVPVRSTGLPVPAATLKIAQRIPEKAMRVAARPPEGSMRIAQSVAVGGRRPVRDLGHSLAPSGIDAGRGGKLVQPAGGQASMSALAQSSESVLLDQQLQELRLASQQYEIKILKYQEAINEMMKRSPQGYEEALGLAQAIEELVRRSAADQDQIKELLKKITKLLDVIQEKSPLSLSSSSFQRAMLSMSHEFGSQLELVQSSIRRRYGQELANLLERQERDLEGIRNLGLLQLGVAQEREHTLRGIDERRRSPSLVAEPKTAHEGVAREQSRGIEVLVEALREVAVEKMFTFSLAQFNTEAAKLRTAVKLEFAHVVSLSLFEEFKKFAEREAEVHRRPLTEKEFRACAKAFIKQSGLLDRKMQILKAIDDMTELTPEQKLSAKDAAIRNDYKNVEEFKSLYFRGVPQKEIRTCVYAGVVVPEADHTNTSLSAVLQGLKRKKYDRASYDPRKFFNQVKVQDHQQSVVSQYQQGRFEDSSKDVGRAWKLNRSILQHFSSTLPEGRSEERMTLMQRSMAYLTKFAAMADAGRVGMQGTPVGVRNPGYFRGGECDLTVLVTQSLAGTLGVNPRNIWPVTDSRVMEIVKREFVLMQGNSELDFNEATFANLFENILAKKKVFIDLTEFMANACFGHTSNPADLKMAMEVANGFITEVVRKASEEFLKNRSPELPHIDQGQLDELVQRNLILGSMVHVGEFSALYTGALWARTGTDEKPVHGAVELWDEVAHQFREIISENGFTVGPSQLFDQWLRTAPNPEMVNKMIGDMARAVDTSVGFPDDITGIASFDSLDDFFQTEIFKKFEALCAGPGRKEGPYLKILTRTTTDLLRGLREGEVFKRFQDAGLEGLLQMSLNKMQACMQEAIDKKDDLFAFSNQIQLIHEELSTILAIAQPINPDEFDDMMRGVTDLLPLGFPQELKPHFYIKNSGMRCLTSVLSACEQTKKEDTGSLGLTIAVQGDCYYESTLALGRAQSHSVHTLKGRKLTSSVEALATALSTKGKKIDLYVCEFHHNISSVLEEYAEENVLAQVDALFDKNMVSDRFTVAIDTTISRPDSSEVKAFLAHNKERIASGKLNVVFYRSAQKYDLLGMDHYNGGIMSSVNDDRSFRTFNASIRGEVGEHGSDALSPYNQVGLAYYQKFGQQGLQAYRAAAMSATRRLGNPRSEENPLGVPGEMIMTRENKGRCMLQFAFNSDPCAVFLDIRNPWMKAGSPQAAEFYDEMQAFFLQRARDNPREYSLETRPSFGFFHSNVTIIGAEKFRFNLGLEGDQSLERYRDLFVALNKMLQEAGDDYRDPDIFNAINLKLFDRVHPEAVEAFFQLKKKEFDKLELTFEERLKLASIYANAGNYKAAHRQLENAKKLGKMKSAQQKAFSDVEKLLKKEVIAAKDVLHKCVSENVTKVQEMLREGTAGRCDILRSVIKAFEAQTSLGDDPDAKLIAMLTLDFSMLSPAELEVIAHSAGDAAMGIESEDDPVKVVLKTVSHSARERAKEAYRKELRLHSPRPFFQLIGLRRRPAGGENPLPQHMLGDFLASVQYLTTPENLRKEPPGGGDRLLVPDGHTPIGILLKAYTGYFFKNASEPFFVEAMSAIGSSQRMVNATSEYLLRHSPGSTLYTQQFSSFTSLLNSGAIRKQYISFNEILKDAELGRTEQFTRACEEFLRGVRNSTIELELVGRMFTDEEYLKKITNRAHRDILKQLGAQYLEVAAEMVKPEGLYRIMQQFVANAKRHPQKYMAMLVEAKDREAV